MSAIQKEACTELTSEQPKSSHSVLLQVCYYRMQSCMVNFQQYVHPSMRPDNVLRTAQTFKQWWDASRDVQWVNIPSDLLYLVGLDTVFQTSGWWLVDCSSCMV